MDTEIRFLRELEEDLMAAAWREELGSVGPGRRRARPGRPHRGLLLAGGGLAALLGAAAVVGMLVLPLSPLAGPVPRGASLPVPGNASFSGYRQIGGGGAPAAVPSPAPLPGPSDRRSGLGDVGGPVLERVVRSAELTVVVPRGSFRDRFARAADVAERYGGFVEVSETRGDRAGVLVLRVDAARFGRAMDELRGLGEVERQVLRGRVVTGEVVDLQARLRIALERRRTLVDLLREARTVAETLRVQRALDETQVEIEEIQSRLATLDDLTAQATIRLVLREEGVPVRLTGDTATAPSVGTALRHAVAGFFRVVFAVLVGLGYVLPIAVLVAVVLGVGWLVARRVRRRVPG
ncbi:MAG TPA: DUF4349 domain-containing protein [Actinomycetota bacterium]|nr:DUF4349 domain-containing protein [Actinomycetota bacterium]